ncbi:hypothetical protein TNCV_3446421 [Trichonephila clavipes]|nr:hypothetical protein TNCV_3446421 [Trichonephila clavipes]
MDTSRIKRIEDVSWLIECPRFIKLSSRDQWHHIASEQNPADVLSLEDFFLRRSFVTTLWWHGPELLQSTYSTTVIAEPNLER